MIVVERKNWEEIIRALEPYNNLLILGCGTCATVCMGGGEKEVGILASQLRLYYGKLGVRKEIKELTVQRQCDREFLLPVQRDIESAEVILTMACGAGAQYLVEVFSNIVVLPAVNTKFIGVTSQLGQWDERCSACGACLVGETFGICPITRCSKSLLNGPCGGSQEGKCEVNKEIPCAWQLIYERAKVLGKLDLLEEIKLPKDWSVSLAGGVRKVVREDVVKNKVNINE